MVASLLSGGGLCRWRSAGPYRRERNALPGSGWKIEGGVLPSDSTKAVLKLLVKDNQLYLGAELKDKSVGGSIDDLSSGKLEDFQQWFATYYGPNNAVVAIAGDIDAKTALDKVKRYFGDIPPSPPIARQNAWTAKRTGAHRQSVQDRVSLARLYKVWNVPQWGAREATDLDLAASDGNRREAFIERFVQEGWAESIMGPDQVMRFVRCDSRHHHHHLD